MPHQVELLLTEFVTHDVKRFVVSKPDGFRYEPGQAVDLAIDRDGLRDEPRPFTPTSHPADEVLEFTVKKYPEHEGVTEALHDCHAGELLSISDPFGAITYRGPGVFIAGGTGLTPMLAIIRKLAREGELSGQTLVYSNDTPRDVICEKELRDAFGDRCHLTCTKESGQGYDDRRVDKEYLSDVIDGLEGYFYVCGPPSFVDDIDSALGELGVSPDQIVHDQ